MIIFGWGHKTARNFGPVRKIRCGNCSNETNWHLQKLTTWFTLFFIPVIPYQMNYLLVCPVCRCCVDVKKEEFDKLRELINDAKNQNDVDATQFDSVLSDAGAIRRTETQLNFIRQMKELEMKRED
jgi:hypothetical protein